MSKTIVQCLLFLVFSISMHDDVRKYKLSKRDDGWLKKEDGSSIKDGKEFKELLAEGCKFSVPNKLIIVMGEVNFLAHAIVDGYAGSFLDAAEDAGFYVLVYDYKVGEFTKNDIIAESTDLYGFIFMGHGSANFKTPPIDMPKGTGDFILESGNFDDDKFIAPNDMEVAYNYGLIVTKMCSAFYGDWNLLISSNGRYFADKSALSMPYMWTTLVAAKNVLKKHGN